MNRKRVEDLALALLAMVFFSSAARADSIGIALIDNTQTGAAGTTITFNATLTNLTGSTIFLTGDAATTSDPSLTVDDNPFLNNAPLSLAAGASSGPFALFNVLIASGTPPGMYGFNTFSIEGGPSGADFTTVGSARFNVDVSTTPEPGTFVLFASGLLGLGIRRRLARH